MSCRIAVGVLLLLSAVLSLPTASAAAEDCEPKSSIVSKVEGYYDLNKDRAPSYGQNWERVLVAFGKRDDVTAFSVDDAREQEAIWGGWRPIADELKRLEDCGFDPHAVQSPSDGQDQVQSEAQQDSVQPAAQQQQQVVRVYYLQLIGYDLASYNVRIAKNLQEGGVYDYRFRVGDDSFQGNHPAVCIDLPDPARFSVNVDGLDSNGCVQADRWDTTWHHADVRVWGTSTDDNRVGPDVYAHTIRLQPSSDYTIYSLSHNVDMKVVEDDAGYIRLEPQFGGSGPVGFRVWRTLEGSPKWELTYDVRGAGWTSSGSSITSAYHNLAWRPGEDTGTVLERGFTSMDDFGGTVGLAIDCSLGPAEIRLQHVERGGENLSARTPGAAGYVPVHPADEWVNVCPPAAASTAKATATLTVEKRYQCYGMDFSMGSERLELEWHTAGADANGNEIGVSKDLGLGNGVYRSSATRINLAVGTLTAAEIRDLINSKTTFQNDGRANPIRVTAVGPSTVAAKMVDGSCEYSQTFLGFDVSAARVSFSGGR